MPLISLLLGFFSSSGPIAYFFLALGKKIATKALILPIQFTIMGALVVAKVAFVVGSITIILTIYNTFNDLVIYLNNLSTNSAFDLPIKILDSFGIIEAFVDSFAFFSLSFISLLVIFVTRYFVESLKLASDEFFKIGMLLQA